MPNILKDLQLMELSLVDRPANPLAMAPIFKREGDKSEMEKVIKAYMEANKVDRETAEKALIEILKSKDEVDKEIEKFKEENQKLRKALIDNGFVIRKDSIEKKEEEEEVEMIEVNGVEIAKKDIPEPILKSLEELEDAKLIKKAEETLPNFEVEVAKELLKFDLDEKILEALKAADAAFAAAMEEAGESDPEDNLSDAQTKLDKMVDEYAKEHNIDKYKAYSEVAKTADGKKLINETYEEEK